MRAQHSMDSGTGLGELLTRDIWTDADVRGLEAEEVEALKAWAVVRAHIRQQLHQDLPDTKTFVLCALDACGHAADLTEDERNLVAEARPGYQSALHKHPALQKVVAGIGRDRNEFMAPLELPAQPKIVRIPRVVWRIAAVIALVGLVGVLAYTLTRQSPNWQVIAVAEAESQEHSLPDGSTVRIVGPAELRYHADEFDRQVHLTGGAFFDVESGATVFAVYTDEAVTRVLGTRFGVLDLEGLTEVVVESGHVEVASESLPAESVELTPGQVSRVVTGSAPTAPEPLDISDGLAWTGMLFFRATAMNVVAQRLTDRFDITVSVDPSLEAEEVTGSFGEGETLEDILNALAIPLNAKVEVSASGWHVAPR